MLPDPTHLAPGSPYVADEHWYACGPPPTRRQGWKVYVALSLDNAAAILTAVVPRLLGRGVHLKYVRDTETLRRLNAGMFGYSQVGKCLVAYLDEGDDETVVELMETVAPWTGRCPAVPFARSLGGGLPLYYRYGSYHDRILILDDGVQVDDRRTAEPVPDEVDDWLARHALPDPGAPEFERFLLRYPAVRALVQAGKGGVFLGLDIRSPDLRGVALKVGYPRGQTQPDGSDGCDLIRRELRFYRELAARAVAHVAPALIDSYDDGRRVAAVLEWVDGVNLAAMKVAGDLERVHVEQAWAILEAVHAAGLFFGDAKLSNFLVERDGRVRVVDFELAGVQGSDSLPPIRTFELTNPAPTGPASFDRGHFLASVLFHYRPGAYDFDDRRIDVGEYLSTPREHPAERWAVAQLAEWRDELTR